MRISDWSSDVCSSDLTGHIAEARFGHRFRQNVGRDLGAAGGFGGHGHCAALWVACCRTLDCQSLAASDGGCCGWHSDLRIGPDSHIAAVARAFLQDAKTGRSEEHTSELQSLMRISYAV